MAQQTSLGDTADVTIQIGRPFETMHEERRAATAAFADDLRRAGLTVELHITEYVEGQRGLTPAEWTFIGIATAKVLDLVVDGAMALLRHRRAAGAERKLGFMIYGPDGEKLREWTTDGDD